MKLYKSIHHIDSLQQATVDDLRQIIRSFPIIDNHAHNILKRECAVGNQDYPFESITSEAQDRALHHHTHSSLAYIRGINQLADLFECESTPGDIKTARDVYLRQDYTGLVSKCLDGTLDIMMDDGLSPEAVYPISWHRQFLPRVWRIARIESIAAELLEELVHEAGLLKLDMDVDWNTSKSESFLIQFDTTFRGRIRALTQDRSVRGFKSVVCYRTGLDVGLESHHTVERRELLTASSLLSSFHEFVQRVVRKKNYRIEHKAVNDYLVVVVCDILEKLIETDDQSMPFQFHTGLGDSDIDLIKANPAHMKSLITAFPDVNFVLLHASYPFTREAGYLASVFANVWLDIGLVFPLLSREGQESALRHSLELAPTSKILWSTDGHLHPETYYLSNRQFRTALERVFIEYVDAGDLSVPQAINAAVDILFWNSNRLYGLNEEERHPQLAKACGRFSTQEASSSNRIA